MVLKCNLKLINKPLENIYKQKSTKKVLYKA